MEGCNNWVDIEVWQRKEHWQIVMISKILATLWTRSWWHEMILSVDHCQHDCNILISKQILLLLLLHCNLILVTPNSRDMSRVTCQHSVEHVDVDSWYCNYPCGTSRFNNCYSRKWYKRLTCYFLKVSFEGLSLDNFFGSHFLTIIPLKVD